MEINALLMDETDNVVTCVTEILAGGTAVYRRDSGIDSLKAEENIPYCHKIAIVNLETGAEVYKYGELIGKTTEPIAKGHWVSHNNIYSVPRDYESELAEEDR